MQGSACEVKLTGKASLPTYIEAMSIVAGALLISIAAVFTISIVLSISIS